ncbi:hepatic sodium/bile acid cotransporter-like [Synchiropus splendidus]|uniref:hepatic sodium/bile acid cotransporter-like n=1 Tax=Synchiropus splendidus TaxID=270530 RepID=UPI00237E8F8C|nr:hepatic sodium/bile acid cotransporter-like [Synchiropus splendidus]
MNTTDVLDGVHHQQQVFGNRSADFLSSGMSGVINIFAVVILFIIMISLGCTMEVSKIRAHLLKPKGVAIAIVAQFGIMPLTAFCLAKSLDMEPIKAVTVLICGCCPGGTLSNAFSLAINGDMNLSIVMTTCSSVAALGLMPLMLMLYCRGFPGLQEAVPYTGIIIALVLTLVPCGIGIAVKHYKPKYCGIILNGGIVIMIISAIVVFTLSALSLGETIWLILMPDLIVAAALMPLIGYILGYVLSLVCRLSHQCSRTVSMETGCQNIQLSTTILKVAFPSQVIGPMFLFPLLLYISQWVEVILLILCYRCYQKLKGPAAAEPEIYKCVNQDEVKRPQV